MSFAYSNAVVLLISFRGASWQWTKKTLTLPELCHQPSLVTMALNQLLVSMSDYDTTHDQRVCLQCAILSVTGKSYSVNPTEVACKDHAVTGFQKENTMVNERSFYLADEL